MLAALCTLTQRSDAALNDRMRHSYAMAPSSDIGLYWCLFLDEGSPSQRADAQTVLLARPAFVSRRPEYACVAKILAWLQHAHTSLAANFIGWMDSDTWLMPSRLATLLGGINRSNAISAPGGVATPVWLGMYMHWARFDNRTLDGMGCVGL